MIARDLLCAPLRALPFGRLLCGLLVVCLSSSHRGYLTNTRMVKGKEEMEKEGTQERGMERERDKEKAKMGRRQVKRRKVIQLIWLSMVMVVGWLGWVALLELARA